LKKNFPISSSAKGSICWPSPIGSIFFENYLVPAANRLGEEGERPKIAMHPLDFFRTTMTSFAVGFAHAVFGEALKYAKERMAFDQPISKYQLV